MAPGNFIAFYRHYPTGGARPTCYRALALFWGFEERLPALGGRNFLRENMKMLKARAGLLAVLTVGVAALTIAGCSATATKSPDVSQSIRTSLDQAGLKDVTVSQDRDKGVVTLGGHVDVDDAKLQAEAVAKSFAGGQVVADQIAVIPPGAESAAKAVNSDLDDAIGKNLDAALIQSKLHENVKYSVKNGVVTLSGQVNSQSKREHAAQIASSIPNTQQVVNELQIKDQKASSIN